MKYNLIVEDYGKIKHANIEVSPLTLIVGDNNSGKSYLLSLLWGLISSDFPLYPEVEELPIEENNELYSQIENMVKESREKENIEIILELEQLQVVLNTILEEKKDILVKSIFNYEGVSIGKLRIEFPRGEKITVTTSNKGRIWHYHDYFAGEMRKVTFTSGIPDKYVVQLMIESILRGVLGNSLIDFDSTIYLPAARTGFMLAKDVINKVGRRAAYDVIGVEKSENAPGMQPFTKPIMQFLDTLEDLSIDSDGSYVEIAKWTEEVMAHGNVQYSESNRKEIRYVPLGEKESIPLRTTSAVVTELAPLIMMLKYKKSIDRIYYEEPEMCLHPQLQQEMGRLLIRLVNEGIPVIATTHSDIIIQHINNMCRLAELKCPPELMEKFQFSKEDAIDIKNIAIYQLTDKGNYSEVEKITPKNGEFQVRTFSNALYNILEQTSEVQEFEMRQED